MFNPSASSVRDPRLRNRNISIKIILTRLKIILYLKNKSCNLDKILIIIIKYFLIKLRKFIFTAQNRSSRFLYIK